MTFIQRFGGALNLNVHCHCVFLEGVYLDRTEAGLKPRFVKVEPPTDADIADVVQKISRRVIRTLRRLGYLEAGIDAAVATGYDPLLDNEPTLARTMAASLIWSVAWAACTVIRRDRSTAPGDSGSFCSLGDCVDCGSTAGGAPGLP